MNRVFLAGRLGKDPELRYTQQQLAVVNVTLATNKFVNQKESTSWHNVTAWGKTGEYLKKYYSKGDFVCIEGDIDYKQWTDDKGVKHNQTVINAFKIEGIPSIKNKQDSQEIEKQGNQSTNNFNYDLDNIPF